MRAEDILDTLSAAIADLNSFRLVVRHGNAVARNAGEVVHQLDDVIARSIAYMPGGRRAALRRNVRFMLALVDGEIKASNAPPGFDAVWGAALPAELVQASRSILQALDQAAVPN